MIKKLKAKFIAITMMSVFIVFGIILTATFVINYLMFEDQYKANLDKLSNFYLYAILLFLFALVSFFIFIYILSSQVFSPVKESYDKQKKFISNASHELKTPLTIISANNELIEMTTGENNHTKAISGQIAKMTEMIHDLSTLAKMDEQIEVDSVKKFNISDALLDNIENFKNVFLESGIEFNYDVEEELEFKGDENLFRTLFSIILDNARKYSSTYLYISLKKNQNKKLEFIFKNDNENIKKGSLNDVFERFFRTDEARASKIEGSGIGLSIAKEIVDYHHGSIDCVSPEDHVFMITIIL